MGGILVWRCLCSILFVGDCGVVIHVVIINATLLKLDFIKCKKIISYDIIDYASK